MIVFTSENVYKYGKKWRAQLDFYDENGARHRKTRTLDVAGKKEAKALCAEWKKQLEEEERAKQEVPEPDPEPEPEPVTTVSDLLGQYIESKRVSVEASTYSEYLRLADKLINPYLGNVDVTALTPDDIQDWINEVSDAYAPATVRKASVILKAALEVATDRKRISGNPFDKHIQRPKSEDSKPNALVGHDRAMVVALLRERMAGGSPSPALLGVMIALYTGMREGEICALRWKNVDLASNSLEVVEALGFDASTNKYYIKAPKSKNSVRPISYSPELTKALKARRAAMMEDCLAAGIAFSPDLFVLGGIDGTYMRTRYLSKKWRELASALELVGTQGRRPTFHDLRHTYATTAIANGADVKTVSVSMGHGDASITLDTYTSADPAAARRVADTVGRAYDADANSATGMGEVLSFKTGTEG